MAIFTVKLDCDNAAFEDDMDGEIVRILLSISARIDSNGIPGFCETVRDINGNDVGCYTLALEHTGQSKKEDE